VPVLQQEGDLVRVVVEIRQGRAAVQVVQQTQVGGDRAPTYRASVIVNAAVRL
jgi:hypothetical protein